MKGLAEESIAKIILVIIFVVVIVAVFFNYVPYLQNIAAKFFPGSNPETADVDNALKCTYFRCTKGCDSNEVKALTATWVDPQTHNDVSCADFCKSGQNICNDDSKNNPVRVDIAENAFIAQTNLASEIGTNCIISPDFKGVFSSLDWLGIIQDSITAQASFATMLISTLQGKNNANYLYIQNSGSIDPTSIQNTQVDCYVAQTKLGSGALASLNLVPGKYNIYMRYFVGIGSTVSDMYIAPYQKISTSTSST